MDYGNEHEHGHFVRNQSQENQGIWIYARVLTALESPAACSELASVLTLPSKPSWGSIAVFKLFPM